MSFWLFSSDLVMASTQVLDERVPGCHGPGGAVRLCCIERRVCSGRLIG